MHRRTFLAATGGVVGAAMAGCVGGGDDDESTGLTTRIETVGDRIDSFDSCVVEFDGLALVPGGGGDMVTFSVGDAAVDLVEAAGGDTSLLTRSTPGTGRYASMKLAVDGVSGRLSTDQDVQVSVPEDPLTFDVAFEVLERKTTVFTAAVEVVWRDGSGFQLLARPDASSTSVESEGF